MCSLQISQTAACVQYDKIPENSMHGDKSSSNPPGAAQTLPADFVVARSSYSRLAPAPDVLNTGSLDWRGQQGSWGAIPAQQLQAGSPGVMASTWPAPAHAASWSSSPASTGACDHTCSEVTLLVCSYIPADGAWRYYQ